MGSTMSRSEQITQLRNKALMAALNDLLKFIDPDNKDCDVSPEVRKEAASYLESWVAGPLAAALRMRDLGAWEHAETIVAQRYLELLDELDAKAAGRG